MAFAFRTGSRVRATVAFSAGFSIASRSSPPAHRAEILHMALERVGQRPIEERAAIEVGTYRDEDERPVRAIDRSALELVEER